LFANFSSLSAQSGFNFEIGEGKQIRKSMRLNNNCSEPHQFRIKNKNKYLSFEQSIDSILVGAKSSVALTLSFNATGLKKKTYSDKIEVECIDCKKQESCKQNRDEVAIRMSVVSATDDFPPTIAQATTPVPAATPTPAPTIEPAPTSSAITTPTVNRDSETPTPEPNPTAALASADTPAPEATATPTEAQAETSPPVVPLTGTNASTPVSAPVAETLQNQISPAIENVDKSKYLPIVLVLILALLPIAFIARKFFERRKYGKTAKNIASLKKAISIKEELANKWMKRRKNQNLHAIGVGKIEGTDNFCIQLFVENASGEMPDNPPINLLPEKFRKFPIVIYEAPSAVLLGFDSNGSESAARERCETLTGGISGANTNLANQTGTIGYFCVPTLLRPIRKLRQDVFLLSNSHVFADLNKAKKDAGDLIQQPSPGENGRHDFVASLENYVPIKFDNDVENPNYTDAAIARLFQDKTHRPEIPVIGKINECLPKEQVEIKQKCRKFGRTTGYTEGEIFSIHLSIWIKYAATGQETFFKEQFLIVPNASHEDFVKGGDSGALVADYENKAIGLIFAGADLNASFDIGNLPDAPGIENLLALDTKKIKSYGVANPINEVLKALNVKLMLP
jgi:hypothetical protein